VKQCFGETIQATRKRKHEKRSPKKNSHYTAYCLKTYDAIKYVYDTYLPGKSFKFHDPVAGTSNGQDLSWVSESIAHNGAIIDVVDWHHYVGSPSGTRPDP